jgi:heat shock protein HslJ
MQLLALLVVSLTACGSEVVAVGGGGGSPAGTSYLSVKVTEDGKAKELVPNTRIRLNFGDDGALSFNAGCNQLGGEFSLDGDKLVMDEYGGTEMGCDPARLAQDEWLGKLLTERPTWKLDGDTLTLTRGSTALVLQDRAIVEPDLPIDGTTWTVDGVITKEVVEHFGSVPPATITIKDGRVVGSTGCNQFHGTVTHTATTLTFGELAVTDKACTGDAARLQDDVLARLKGELTYSIDHNRLELRRGDLGLTLIAGK